MIDGVLVYCPSWQVYKAGALTVEKLKDADIGWKDIFEEIPISVHTSDLTKALMATVEPVC